MKIRKTLFAIAAVLSVCAAAFTGCSAKEEEKPPAVTTAAVNNYEAKTEDRIVTGEVIAVTENEVTLALGNISAEKPGRPSRGNSSESPEGERPEMPEGERPDFNGERPEMPEGGFPDFNGERPEMPEGGFPDFNGERPEMPEGAEKPSGRKRNVSIEKTGAEETFIIPVGMTVDGLSGRNTDYKGISVGTVLTLTVNSDGVVCAASVG